MKKSVTRRSHTAGRTQPTLALRPLAAAISALLLPVGAHAQRTAANVDPNSTLEDVVVTGIRHSIETSVAAKRENESIVEVISSEDLGKLPDTSIADSLARLPGLTAQRVDGRAQGINIRGMAEKYAVTLLNGRELVSTGDNRGVEFDQFPSELIGGVTVYKTPDASLGSQGLSGTINLQTIRPLDFKETTGNFNARGSRNAAGALVPGSSDEGGRISASYITQFADHTVGLALAFAHLDEPGQEKYTKGWWWTDMRVWGPNPPGGGPVTPGLNYTPDLGWGRTNNTLNGFEMGVMSTSHVRDSAMAVIELKPNDSYHGVIDLYYSQFKQHVDGREFQANLSPPDWSGIGLDYAPTPIAIPQGTYFGTPTITTMGDSTYVTGGNIHSEDPLIVSRDNKRKDNLYSLGFNNEFRGGGWTTVVDLSMSKAKRDETVSELYASARHPIDLINFNAPIVNNGFLSYTPGVNLADPSVVALRGFSAWGMTSNGLPQTGSLSPVHMTDETRAFRVETKHDLDWGIFSIVEAGLNIAHRKKEYAFTQEIYALNDATPCLTENAWAADTCAPIPSSVLQAPVSLAFSGVPQMISFNAAQAMQSSVYYHEPVNVSSSPGRIWGVEETVSTGFAKLGLKFQAGVPWHGNFGVQVVRTKQASTGIAWDSGDTTYSPQGSPVPMELGTSYTNVLPSINLVAELSSKTLLRIGAAKTLARPNMEDMRAGFVASVSTKDPTQPGGGPNWGKWGGSGGNPLLRPWLSKDIDISIEHYFSKRSYVSAAVYKKQLLNSIYKQDTTFDFTGFPNALGTQINPLFGNIGILTAPTNGQGGFVKGIELAASIDFGMLWKPLDGFGTQLSWSHADSNVAGPAIADTSGSPDWQRPLEGLSGRVWSAVLFYEKNGFEARIAQRYRSDFMASVRGVWITNSMSAIQSERITDAQVAYNFQEGPMKGLSLLLQLNNLGDTPYRTETNNDGWTFTHGGQYQMVPEAYQTYGREYLVGFNYKF
jgi:iron complex outermembrane receptor protein